MQLWFHSSHPFGKEKKITAVPLCFSTANLDSILDPKSAGPCESKTGPKHFCPVSNAGGH